MAIKKRKWKIEKKVRAEEKRSKKNEKPKTHNTKKRNIFERKER